MDGNVLIFTGIICFTVLIVVGVIADAIKTTVTEAREDDDDGS